MPDMNPIEVEKAVVTEGRLTLEVRVSSEAPLKTTPQIADAALRIRPTLARHACINAHGPTFAAVMAATSLPHLFEHLIIDEQVRSCSAASSASAFTGSTEWIDRPARRARVQVSFADDIAALQAVTRAQALMRQILA